MDELSRKCSCCNKAYQGEGMMSIEDNAEICPDCSAQENASRYYNNCLT